MSSQVDFSKFGDKLAVTLIRCACLTRLRRMIGGVGASAFVDVDDDGVITQQEARAAHYGQRLNAVLQEETMTHSLKHLTKEQIKPKQRLSANMERAVNKWNHSKELWSEYDKEERKEKALQAVSKEAQEARATAAADTATQADFNVWQAASQGQTDEVMAYVGRLGSVMDLTQCSYLRARNFDIRKHDTRAGSYGETLLHLAVWNGHGATCGVTQRCLTGGSGARESPHRLRRRRAWSRRPQIIRQRD